jgi:hypothetical protein
MIGSNPLTKPLAPRSSANRGGGPYSLRSNQEAVPSRDSATVVARSSQSLPPSRHRWSFLRLVDYHVLLPPFAFQRALPRFLLTARSWLQGDVCFLCLPPGFPAVPPYLTHTCAAFAQRATMLALTPPPTRLPVAPSRDPSASKSRSDHSLSPLAVLNGLPPATIFHTGSRQPVLWDGEGRPPRIVRASFRPRSPAQHPSSPARTRSLCTRQLGASSPLADWPSPERLIHGFVIL